MSKGSPRKGRLHAELATTCTNLRTNLQKSGIKHARSGWPKRTCATPQSRLPLSMQIALQTIGIQFQGVPRAQRGGCANFCKAFPKVIPFWAQGAHCGISPHGSDLRSAEAHSVLRRIEILESDSGRVCVAPGAMLAECLTVLASEGARREA